MAALCGRNEDAANALFFVTKYYKMCSEALLQWKGFPLRQVRMSAKIHSLQRGGIKTVSDHEQSK